MAAAFNPSKDKLDIFAAIAVNGAVTYSTDPVEQSREFIRITTQLDTTDILVLRELSRAQDFPSGIVYAPNERQDQMRGNWSEFLAQLDRMVKPIFYRSAFVRLQALGMAERLTPGFGSADPLYEVLELGKLYVAYLSDHHSTSRVL